MAEAEPSGEGREVAVAAADGRRKSISYLRAAPGSAAAAAAAAAACEREGEKLSDY